MIRIGISPRLFHPQPGARGVHKKLLHYLEHSVGEWIASHGALVYLIPAGEGAADYASDLDGLVLQGGADISPLAYGEQPLKPEWAGDALRDRVFQVVQDLGVDAARARLGMEEPRGDADLRHAFSATSTSSSIFLASPNNMRLFSL